MSSSRWWACGTNLRMLTVVKSRCGLTCANAVLVARRDYHPARPTFPRRKWTGIRGHDTWQSTGAGCLKSLDVNDGIWSLLWWHSREVAPPVERNDAAVPGRIDMGPEKVDRRPETEEES